MTLCCLQHQDGIQTQYDTTLSVHQDCIQTQYDTMLSVQHHDGIQLQYDTMLSTISGWYSNGMTLCCLSNIRMVFTSRLVSK